MNGAKIVFTRRNLPHWRMTCRIYFVTWRLHRSQTILQTQERILVGDALRHFDTERYLLGTYVVTDDHVHVLVGPLPGFGLDEIVRSWRSFTANRLQREHARHGKTWQIEPYDRIMRDADERDADEATEQAKDIRDNPFKRWPEIDRYEYTGCGQLDY